MGGHGGRSIFCPGPSHVMMGPIPLACSYLQAAAKGIKRAEIREIRYVAGEDALPLIGRCIVRDVASNVPEDYSQE